MKTALLFILMSISTFAQARGGHDTKKDDGHERNDTVIRGTLDALETEGLLRADQVNPAKTWIDQKAFQKLSKRRSRRIYSVWFSLQNGEQIGAIAVLDESSIEEEGGLVVYVVSKILQPDGKAVPPRR